MREKADQPADGGDKGVKVGCGHAVDLLHELQRVERVAVRRGAMVPARDEHPAALRQEPALLHCAVRRLQKAHAKTGLERPCCRQASTATVPVAEPSSHARQQPHKLSMSLAYEKLAKLEQFKCWTTARRPSLPSKSLQ